MLYEELSRGKQCLTHETLTDLKNVKQISGRKERKPRGIFHYSFLFCWPLLVQSSATWCPL